MDRRQGISPKLSGDAPGSSFRRGGAAQRQYHGMMQRSWRAVSSQSGTDHVPTPDVYGTNRRLSKDQEYVGPGRRRDSARSRSGHPEQDSPAAPRSPKRGSEGFGPETVLVGQPVTAPSYSEAADAMSSTESKRDPRGKADTAFADPALDVSVVGTRTSQDAGGAFTQYEVRVRVGERQDLDPSQRRSKDPHRPQSRRRPLEWRVLRRFKQFVSLHSDLRAAADDIDRVASEVDQGVGRAAAASPALAPTAASPAGLVSVGGAPFGGPTRASSQGSAGSQGSASAGARAGTGAERKGGAPRGSSSRASSASAAAADSVSDSRVASPHHVERQAQLEAMRALELPPKTVFSSLSRDLIDERKGRLEAFLRAAARIPIARATRALRRFLDSGTRTASSQLPLLDRLLDFSSPPRAAAQTAKREHQHNNGGYLPASTAPASSSSGPAGHVPMLHSSATRAAESSDDFGAPLAQATNGSADQAAMISALQYALLQVPGGNEQLAGIMSRFGVRPPLPEPAYKSPPLRAQTDLSRVGPGAAPLAVPQGRTFGSGDAGEGVYGGEASSRPSSLQLPPPKQWVSSGEDPAGVAALASASSLSRSREYSSPSQPRPEQVQMGSPGASGSLLSAGGEAKWRRGSRASAAASYVDSVVSEAGTGHSAGASGAQPLGYQGGQRDSITSLPRGLPGTLPPRGMGHVSVGKHELYVADPHAPAGGAPLISALQVSAEYAAQQAPLLAPQHFESNMAALSATLRACARVQAAEGLQEGATLPKGLQARAQQVVPSRAAVDDVTDALLLSLVPGDAERELMRRVSAMLAALTSKVAGGRVFPLGPVPAGAGMAGDRVLLSLFMSPDREVKWVLGASEALLALPEVEVSAARIGGWPQEGGSRPTGQDRGRAGSEAGESHLDPDRSSESGSRPSRSNSGALVDPKSQRKPRQGTGDQTSPSSRPAPVRMQPDLRSASSDALLHSSPATSGKKSGETAQPMVRARSKLSPADRGRSLNQMLALPGVPSGTGLLGSSRSGSPGQSGSGSAGPSSLMHMQPADMQRAIVAAAVSEHSSVRSVTSSERRGRIGGPGWESTGSVVLSTERTKLASQHTLGAAVEEAIAAVDSMDREQRTLWMQGRHPAGSARDGKDAVVEDDGGPQQDEEDAAVRLAAAEAARAIEGSAAQRNGRGSMAHGKSVDGAGVERRVRRSTAGPDGDEGARPRQHTRGGSFVSSAVGSFTSREQGSFTDLADSVAQATGMGGDGRGGYGGKAGSPLTPPGKGNTAAGQSSAARAIAGHALGAHGQTGRFVLRASFNSATSGGDGSAGPSPYPHKSPGDTPDTGTRARRSSSHSAHKPETAAPPPPAAAVARASGSLPLCQVGHVAIRRGDHERSDSIETLLDGVRVRVVADDLASLATVAAILRVDQSLKRTHLFLRSLILVRTWAAHMAPALTRGAGDAFRQLDLRVFVALLMWVFARRRTVIAQPLQALAWLLFDCTQLRWDEQAVSIEGAVPIDHVYGGTSVAAQGLRVSDEVYSASAAALERKHQSRSSSSAAPDSIHLASTMQSSGEQPGGGAAHKLERPVSSSSGGLPRLLSGASAASAGRLGGAEASPEQRSHARTESASSVQRANRVSSSNSGVGSPSGKGSRSSRSRRQRPPPAAGWPAHVRAKQPALHALIDAPWLLQTRLRCQKRAGPPGSEYFRTGVRVPPPLQAPAGHRLVVEDPLLPGRNLCEGIRARDARRIRRAFYQSCAVICPIVLRATAAEVASVIDAHAGAIAGSSSPSGPSPPSEASTAADAYPYAERAASGGNAGDRQSDKKRARSRSRSRYSSSEPAMAAKALLLTSMLAPEAKSAAAVAAKELCVAFEPMWEAAGAGPEHLGDFDDLTRMMSSGACVSCQARCCDANNRYTTHAGPCCPGCAPPLPGEDVSPMRHGSGKHRAAGRGAGHDSGSEDDETLISTDDASSRKACCEQCGIRQEQAQAALNSCLAASACSAAVQSQEYRRLVLGFDMCCEIESCCLSRTDTDGVCSKCGKIDEDMDKGKCGLDGSGCYKEHGYSACRCQCGCDDTLVMACCVTGHCSCARAGAPSIQTISAGQSSDASHTPQGTALDRVGSYLRVTAGGLLLKELQSTLSRSSTPALTSRRVPPANQPTGRIQCGIVYVPPGPGGSRPSAPALYLAALYAVRVLYRRGTLGGLWSSFFASDPQEVEDYLDYCCMVLDADVTSGALISLAREVLLEHGSLPVGEVGKHLQEAVPHDGLPALLKERFGGLKRFLEHYPDAFVLGRDHQFNPHVYCRDLVTEEGQELIAQGKVLRGLGGHRVPGGKSGKEHGGGHAHGSVGGKHGGERQSGRGQGHGYGKEHTPGKKKRSRRARKAAQQQQQQQQQQPNYRHQQQHRSPGQGKQGGSRASQQQQQQQQQQQRMHAVHPAPQPSSTESGGHGVRVQYMAVPVVGSSRGFAGVPGSLTQQQAMQLHGHVTMQGDLRRGLGAAHKHPSSEGLPHLGGSSHAHAEAERWGYQYRISGGALSLDPSARPFDPHTHGGAGSQTGPAAQLGVGMPASAWVHGTAPMPLGPPPAHGAQPHQLQRHTQQYGAGHQQMIFSGASEGLSQATGGLPAAAAVAAAAAAARGGSGWEAASKHPSVPGTFHQHGPEPHPDGRPRGLDRSRAHSSRDYADSAVRGALAGQRAGPGAAGLAGHEPLLPMGLAAARQELSFERSIVSRGLTLSPTHGPSVLQPADGGAGLGVGGMVSPPPLVTGEPSADPAAMSPVSQAWSRQGYHAKSMSAERRTSGGAGAGDEGGSGREDPFSAFQSGNVLGLSSILGSGAGTGTGADALGPT